MEKNSFLELAASILKEDGNIQITVDTDFKSLDCWSSITAFELTEAIYEKYNVKLRGIEIRRCNTLEDLFILLKSKIQ